MVQLCICPHRGQCDSVRTSSGKDTIVAESVSISVEKNLPVFGHFTARNCMVRLLGADNCASQNPPGYSELVSMVLVPQFFVFVITALLNELRVFASSGSFCIVWPMQKKRITPTQPSPSSRAPQWKKKNGIVVEHGLENGTGTRNPVCGRQHWIRQGTDRRLRRC